MRHHREDIVEQALRVLDDYGLASLTMRRLGAELGLQASAIYHHFPSKQALLAAVADEVLARGRRPRTDGRWDDQLVEVCYELRDAMLAYRDGADLVATVYAFGLGARGPADELEEILARAGFGESLVGVGARTLLHFVFGHTFEEQTALQAESAGAIEGPVASDGSTARVVDRTADFDLGLRLVLDGLGVHAPAGAPADAPTDAPAVGRVRG
ncbi:TetR/AcrR family transcriptional regulator C-terminal domain-containing protein [Nocardioides sp. P5_C9_2]